MNISRTNMVIFSTVVFSLTIPITHFSITVVREPHVRSYIVHPNIRIKGHLMIFAGLLNHFTFCDVITTIMYGISVDNAKNANSFVC